MYQLDANNSTMIFLINGLYMFRTFTCPSSGVLIYRLFHCRMWCFAIGVEAVVLRSWCVVLCTVCQLDTNGQTVHMTTHQLCRTTASTPMAKHHMRQ